MEQNCSKPARLAAAIRFSDDDDAQPELHILLLLYRDVGVRLGES